MYLINIDKRVPGLLLQKVLNSIIGFKLSDPLEEQASFEARHFSFPT